MTEPKVSEGMQDLVCEVMEETHCPRCECDYDGARNPVKSRDALFYAIAALEQRAGEIDFFASIVRDHYADIVMPTVEDRSAAKPSDWINCAINELGTQHKRAEKWKEAAVALYQCSRELADIGCKDFALTNNRLDAAIAALGDEWDEAVR